MAATKLRMRVQELLDERGMTAYQLATGTSFSISTAYRMADDRWTQIDRGKLEEMCDFFGVTPAEIFVYTPSSRVRKAG
jgi:DNA-binding Xre family transcriptional regulator